MHKFLIYILTFCATMIALPMHSYTSDMFGIYIGKDKERETWAGNYSVCDRLTDQCEDHFRSSKALDEITHFFGQKSLVVERYIAMGLALAVDEHGNLIDGEAVDFYREREIVDPQIALKYGIAHSIHKATKQAGLFTASVASKNFQSPREIFRQIPDSLEISPTLDLPTYSGHQGSVFEIHTDELEDPYGNRAPLGLYLQAILKNQQGQYAWSPMIITTGDAQNWINTTTMRGRYELSLSLGRSSSVPQSIYIAPEILMPPEKYELHFMKDTRVLTLKFPNLRTDRGHLVQDAVPFHITLLEQNGEEQSVLSWTLQGSIEAIFSVHEKKYPIEIIIDSDLGSANYLLFEEDLEMSP